MSDFEVKDRKIRVNNSYFAKEALNDYFSKHKLKNNDYTVKEIQALIDSVAYMLDGQAENSDCLIIEQMLEE